MWQPRTVGLVSLIVLGLVGFTLVAPPFARYDMGMSYAALLGPILGVSLTLIGVFLFLWTAVTPQESFSRELSAFVARVPQAVFHSFFTSLLVLDIWFLVVFLLFPGRFGADPTTSHGRDVQIFGCIATSGLLGTFVRQFQSTLRPRELVGHSEAAPQMSSFVRFWSLVASLVSGLFTSVVLFLLLRAGILKSVEVDTFNIYGVTGVAAVSGYFSENIIRRFATIYESLFEPTEKQPRSKGA